MSLTAVYQGDNIGSGIGRAALDQAEGYGGNVSGVVAKAGGTQASYTLLTGERISVDTVVTAADAVGFPLAALGLHCVVANTSANSMQVFGAGTDTINGVAYATGVAQAAGKVALYFCNKSAPAGNWVRLLSA